MIIEVIKGNIFDTDLRHIAFATNIEGRNDAGVAGTVAKYFTKEFLKVGKCNMGDLFSFPAAYRVIFHGLVCHSLEEDGWKDAPNAITTALDKIQVADDEVIAVVLMGSGKLGKEGKADVASNIRAIHSSQKKCVVYTLDQEKDSIMAALT